MPSKLPEDDARMVLASHAAYSVSSSDPDHPLPEDAAAIGLIGPVAGFATGADLIDAAFVGTSADGIVLAFRGTLSSQNGGDHKQTADDWINNLKADLTRGENLPGLVHRGFLDALKELWHDVEPEVIGRLKASPGKRLYITGHSKGGALAHLAAARFVQSALVQGSNITVRSFEGAHPGDQAFANGYLDLVADVTRYEYQDDLVPHLPPSIMFRHLFQAEPYFKPLQMIDSHVDYAPAGKLQFIDWADGIRAQSTLLSTERLFHLARRVTGGEFSEIVADHSISPGSSFRRSIGLP